MCKQLNKNIITCISLMSTTYLWLHNQKRFVTATTGWMDQHVKSRRWFGGNDAHLKGFETWDGWLISGNMHCIFLIQNRLILHGYIHFKLISF